MTVTEILNEGLKRAFTVVLPAGDIQAKVDARLAEMAKDANIPGFRPGKIPLNIMRQRYGLNARGEVLEQSVQSMTQQAVIERGLRPAFTPDVKVTKFGENEDLEWEISFEVLPEITLGDFSAISLIRFGAEVDEEQMTKGLARLAEHMPVIRAAAEQRPAVDGDIVKIDFVGKIDDVAFEGGTAEGVDLKLGAGRFIPGFEEQLLGAAPGETREVKVTFPEDYPSPAVKGKDAVFTVTVQELREEAERPIDEDLAKEYGLDSLDALKARLKDQMEARFKSAARAKLKRALLDALDAAYDFPLPEGLVEREFKGIWEQVQAAKAEGGEDAGKTDEALEAEYRPIAARRVKLGLLLAEVGRVNNVEVKEEELRAALIREAQRYPGQEREVIEFFRGNAQAWESLRAPLFEEKAIDYVLDIATISDKIVSADELFADSDEAAAA